jgi:cobalt/nickel transport system ATP-binding protein
MPPVIEVSQLRFRYPDGTAALDGIDFTLAPGETVALLGANGSGKTTFVLHLNGLLRGEGNIRVCGLPVTDEHLPDIRRRVGLVFQDSDEQLFMPTVLEDVAFGPLHQGLDSASAQSSALAILERLGIAHLASKAPHHLSAGEKRRVAIAGVLVMQPEVLVLDEPTTFLDPPGQRELVTLLRDLPQAKILVTHDMPFAKALAARGVFFQKGRVLGTGPVNELITQFHWGTE